MEDIGEIVLRNVNQAMMAQSNDGSKLAIMTPEVDANNVLYNEIKVYQSDSSDPMDILRVIDDKHWLCRFEEDDKNEMDLNFIQHLQFDNRGTKLIGWGKEKFFVLNLVTQKAVIHEIQSQMFEEILSLTYMTHPGRKKDECVLTCKSTGKLQIIVYDFFDTGESDESQENNSKGEEMHYKSRETLKTKLETRKQETYSGVKRKISDFEDESAPHDDQESDWMFPFCVDFFEDTGSTFIAKMSSKNDSLIFVN